MKYYVTTQGDMWDSIAQDQMGSTDHTGLLMRANMRYALLGAYIFPAGARLAIPDVPQRASGGLPPWKQVSR